MTGNIAQLLLERAGERPGLRIGTLDDQMALHDALSVAAGGAHQLAASGLTSKNRVAIVAGSSTEFLLVWMACVLAAVPVAFINPTYPQGLLAEMLQNLDPQMVFTDLDETGFVGGRRASAMTGCREWTLGEADGCPGIMAGRLDTVSFMHTSGTTGVPKFCAQTHEYFLRLAGAMSQALGLTSADRMLAPLPLFHINPFGYGIIGALTAGADALSVRRFSAGSFWPDVREHRITALALHAPPVEILKRATTPDDSRGHRVRTMFYADADFMERFGIHHAVSGYGSTEAAGVSHLHGWHSGDDIPEHASRYGGQPRADVEDRIDESGEIFVREREPGTLFAGYVTTDGLDRSRDHDGWFATGDLGRRDDAGGLVFLERSAESIRVKGEFVPISFVEARLGRIDALDDLALWKRPGELVDDEVVLYVVADHVPVALIEKAVAGLPSFMRPRLVAHVQKIPRDAAAGKVQRRLLPDEEVLQWITMA